jgi:hypothetical protein
MFFCLHWSVSQKHAQIAQYSPNDECMKEKLRKLIHKKTATKNYISDLWRGINEFKKHYQPGTNFVKDKMVNLLAHSHGISK